MKKIFTIIYLISFSSIFAQYTDLNSDIDWSAGYSSVSDIVTSFQYGRTQENIQLSTTISETLIMPTQAIWDAKSESQKALYLINAERVARALLPLESEISNIETISQAYATYLLDNDVFGHSENGSVSDRLNADPAISGCNEIGGAENLAAFVTSGSSISLPVERAVYSWIYDDASSSWGHRQLCFATFTNNFGESSNEGFMGIGLATGGPWQGPFPTQWNHVAIVVYNLVDPCASSTLPVELTTYSAKVLNNNIELTWETATEVNNYGFEIERNFTSSNMSNDFIFSGDEGWGKIGFVEGHGNSNSPKYYSFTDNSISESGKYKYRLKQIDIDGKFEYSPEVEVNFEVPIEFELSPNYPNPFNPNTTIRFSLPEAAQVKLVVYDMLGQQVAELLREKKDAGFYNVNFNAENLTSGMYVYKLTAGEKVQTKKMLLIK